MQQLTLIDESQNWLKAFEQRLRQLKLSRLFYWTGTLHDIFADMRRERQEAYEQVMQLEGDLGRIELSPAQSEQLAYRIASLKGMLTLLMLALVLHGIAGDASDEMRRPASIRTVRTVRNVRRGREELTLEIA